MANARILAKRIIQNVQEIPSETPFVLRYHYFEIIHNAVPTRVRERWRKHNTLCALCDECDETLGYLYAECKVSRRAMALIMQSTVNKATVSCLQPAGVEDLTFRTLLSAKDRRTLLIFSFCV